MALSCIISEMKRDNGGKSPFLVPPAFDSPVRGFRRNIAIRSGTKQLLVLIQYTNVTANRTDRHRATAQAAAHAGIARQKSVGQDVFLSEISPIISYMQAGM